MSEQKNTLNLGGGKVGKLTVGVQSDDPKAAIEAAKVPMSNTADIKGNALVDDAVVGVRIESASDLRAKLAGLQAQIEQAAAAGQIQDADDVADAKKAIARADEELQKPTPDGNRVLKNMESLSNILKNAGEIGVKLAPVATLLFTAAKAFFGIP